MNELSISVTPLSDGLVTIMDQKLPSESDSGILCDEQYNTGNRKFIRRKIHTVRSRLILPVRVPDQRQKNPHP